MYIGCVLICISINSSKISTYICLDPPSPGANVIMSVDVVIQVKFKALKFIFLNYKHISSLILIINYCPQRCYNYFIYVCC